MMTAMVDIERSPWFGHQMCDKRRQFSVKKSLPFVESIRGVYTHRVRRVTVYTGEGKSHMAITCWCGMSICISSRKPNRLVAEPSNGRKVCATCEGRVVGAGASGLQEINGRQVKYTPRRAS